MKKPSIALLLGGAPHDGGSGHDLGDGGEDEYDHLDPDEIDKHAEAAMEAFEKACEDGDHAGMWAAFKTAHALHHALWDHEDGGDEEEPEEGADEEEEHAES